MIDLRALAALHRHRPPPRPVLRVIDTRRMAEVPTEDLLVAGVALTAELARRREQANR